MKKNARKDDVSRIARPLYHGMKGIVTLFLLCLSAVGAYGQITDLNGLTASTQSFANDTNVTISSSGSTHTLGWSGTLGVGRGGTGTGTAFTSGSIVFAGASGVYSQDNSNLFWDDTNNRLGIGVSPTKHLHIKSNVNAADSFVIENASGGTGAYAEIGAVNDGGGSSGIYMRSTSSGFSGSGAIAADIGQINADSGLSGGLAIVAAASAPIMFYTAGVATSNERMRIEYTGKVGIGVSSPSTLLHVSKNQNASTQITVQNTDTGNSAFSSMLLINGTTDSESMHVACVGQNYTENGAVKPDAGHLVAEPGLSNGMSISASASGGAIRFYTGGIANSNQRITISSRGNILLGTTTDATANDGKVLIFGDNTNDPTLGASTAAIYAKTSSGTVAMFAHDTVGNAMQLSSHNFSLFDPDESYACPWSVYSENGYIGKRVNVDMYGAIRTLELMTGKRFIYEEDLPETEIMSWDAEQEKFHIEREKLIEMWERLTPEQRQAMPKPEPYAKQPPPPWLRKRLKVPSKLW